MNVPFDRDSAWLRAAMKLPVSASLGPMGPVLQQVHSLVASGSGRSLPEGVSANEIRLLGEGLEGLCVSLKDLSEEDHEPSFTAKCWMKEVREICYDAEDMLDSQIWMHSGARESERLGIISWIRSRLEKQHRLFSELMARVEDASEIRRRLQLDPKTISPDRLGQSGVSRLMPQVSIQQLEGPMNKLVELLAFDDEDKKLLVVAVFGSAGVGKTTLVRSLYHRFRGEFQCRAFLRVSRDPDMRRLLTSMLSQIKAPAHPLSDVQDLVENIREHLKGKRCLIVIDDLWASSTFDIISCAFLGGDCHSRIIVTTQIEDVALACRGCHSGYIFKMGSLDDDKSGELLLSRIFYSESSCTNPTSKEIKEVYNNLPTHLKTCLLYLNMYPDGYTISKDNLVKQWVAEGFLSDMEGQDTEEIARGYFDELVSRGMIQPVDTNHNDEVLSCTICRTVLDLVRYKSIEENFITVVGHFQTTLGLLDKIRRLSVQFGDAKCANISAGFRISQVRSLIFFGFLNCVPSIVDTKLLRVLILHVWVDQDKSFDLTVISELIRLRYLKIECNTTVHLPHKIQGLRYLETLEVDARVADIPPDIGQLKNLLHLRIPSDNVKDLVSLTRLMHLHLTCSTDHLNRLVFKIGSFLWKFNNLQSLILNAGPSSMRISCNGWSSMYPPSRLERIELLPRICIFPSLPKWLQELDKLCVLKIAVRELSEKDVDILKELPALGSLTLYVQTTLAERIILDKEGFPVLTYFKFMCAAPCLSFLEGAVPNVRKLKLGFNGNRRRPHSLMVAGFQNLSSLREISVKVGGAGSDELNRKVVESALKAAVSNHPNTVLIRVHCVDIFYDKKVKGTVTQQVQADSTPEKQHEMQEEGVSDAISEKTQWFSYGGSDKSTKTEDRERTSGEKKHEIRQYKIKKTVQREKNVNKQAGSRANRDGISTDSSPVTHTSFGRSIVSSRRDSNLPQHDHAHQASSYHGIDAFQRRAADLILDLLPDTTSPAAPEMLSLAWTRHLLDSFLFCFEEFRSVLFNCGGAAALARPPLDRLATDLFDRAVKALDLCNALRDGVDLIRQWLKHYAIAAAALASPDADAPFGEGQIRRARKALTDLTILMLDDKDGGGVFVSQQNRSFGRGTKDGYSRGHHRWNSTDGSSGSRSCLVSRSWSASRQLQAIGENLPVPRPSDITATGGLASAVYTMGAVLFVVAWSLVAAIPCQDRGFQAQFAVPRSFPWAGPVTTLYERILEESKKKECKHSCGLLKEIHQAERWSRQLMEITDAAQFPLAEEKDAQVREAAQELLQVCQTLKDGLDPLEQQLREMFHQILRIRTEIRLHGNQSHRASLDVDGCVNSIV